MGITLAHLKEAVDRLLDRIALVAQTASKSIEEMGKTKADKVNIMSLTIPASGWSSDSTAGCPLSGHPGVRPDGKRLCGRSGSTDLCKDRPDGRTHIDRKLCRKTAAASAADADSCHHGSLLHCEIGGMDLWHGVPYRSAAV